MSYVLQAILAKEGVIDQLLTVLKAGKKISLEQGFAMIPLDEALIDRIDASPEANSIPDLIYLTDAFEEKVLGMLGEAKFGYLESEFFGGSGGHQGIVWEAGKRILKVSESYSGANRILRELGVRRTSQLDEFDCMGLGRHRSVDEWLEENP